MTILTLWQWVFVVAIGLGVRSRGHSLLGGVLAGMIVVPCAPVAWDGLLAYRQFKGIQSEISKMDPGTLQTGFKAPVQEILERRGIDKRATEKIKRTRVGDQVNVELAYEVTSPFLANAVIVFVFDAAVPVGGKAMSVADRR